MLVTFCQEHVGKYSHKLILQQISEGSQAIAGNNIGPLWMGISVTTTAGSGKECLGL